MTFFAVLLVSVLAGVCSFACAFVMSQSFIWSLSTASVVACVCFVLLALVQIGADVLGPVRRSR